MKKHLCSLLFFALLITVYSYGQTPVTNSSTTRSPYEYYISMSGVNAKTDVIALEKNIGSRTSVTYFMAVRFPVKYFLLRSTQPVSMELFNTWIDQSLYKLESFGEGDIAREKAIMAGRKKH